MYAIKLLILLSIVILCTYIGILMSKKLKDREYILREMITFLGLVENEIKYMLAVLPNAYESSRQKLTTQLKPAMGQIVVDMLSLNSQEAMNQSIVRNISIIDGLKDYDKNVFCSTLKNLGRSDVDGQVNIIENTISILENQIKEANDEKLKNSKLYRTLGAISGLMIAIILV